MKLQEPRNSDHELNQNTDMKLHPTVENTPSKNPITVSQGIRASIAALSVSFGHSVLEPLGVPHGTAEQVAITLSTLLFAPEMIVSSVKFASSDILEKVKKIKK